MGWQLLRYGSNRVALGALVVGSGLVAGEALAAECPDQPECGYGFIRGDANNDKTVDMADAVVTLNYLFSGGPAPCLEAADTNDDGQVGMDDAVSLLNYLFQSGAPPAGDYPQTEASCALYEDFPDLPELESRPPPTDGGGGASAGFVIFTESPRPFDGVTAWLYTTFEHPFAETDWSAMWEYVYEFFPYSDVWDCYWDDPVESGSGDAKADPDMSYRDINVNLFSDAGDGGCACQYDILADAGAKRGWIIPVELGFKACSDSEWTTEFGVTGDAFWGSYREPPNGEPFDDFVNQWESAEYQGELDFCPDCLEVRFRTVNRAQQWETLFEGEYWCVPGCEPDAEYWILDENHRTTVHEG